VIDKNERIMNKAFLFLLFASFLSLVASHSSYAQMMTPDENPIFNGERKFTAGIALGTNISQVDGDNLSGFSKVGLNAGPVLNVNFTNKVALGLEILYSQKGSHSVGTSNSTAYGTYFASYTMNLKYAEVPLILYYNLQPKYQFGIGASYNVLISSNETYSDANFTTTLDPTIYAFNKSYVDALISGSMVLWQGLVLQLRYQYSITPIRDYDHTPISLGLSGGNQKNNSFALRFIYLF
jgi:hypothetical protein